MYNELKQSRFELDLVEGNRGRLGSYPSIRDVTCSRRGRSETRSRRDSGMCIYTASREPRGCGGRKSNLNKNQMIGHRWNEIQKTRMCAFT